MLGIASSNHDSFEMNLAPVTPNPPDLDPAKRRTIAFFAIENLAQSFQDKYRAGSILGGISTLSVAIIGIGMLLLPYSLGQSGLVWGIIQLLACAGLSHYSLVTVVRCAAKRKTSSYQELAELTWGKGFRNFVNIVSFLAGIGTSVVYMKMMVTLCAAFVASVWPDSSFSAEISNGVYNKYLLTLMVTAFVLPLCLPKEFKTLRYIWLLGAILILFVSSVIVAEKFIYPVDENNKEPPKKFVLNGFSTTFPNAVFAFACQINILIVFGELRNPTTKRMKKVIGATTLSVLFIYLLVGIIGYLTFTSMLRSNQIIILAYTSNPLDPDLLTYSPIINSCIVLLCILVIVKAPMYIRPASDGIKDIFFPLKSDRYGEPVETNEPPVVRILLTISMVYLSLVVAIFAENIQFVMSVIASTLYVLISYAFPAIFYLRLPRENQKMKYRIMSFVTLVGMLTFAVWKTYQNIQESVNQKVN